MAGLFGLFGKKNNDGSQNSSDDKGFYLEFDEARTLGDLEYMRTPKTVRRTFPGNSSNGGEFEQTKIISAMGETVVPEGTVMPEMNGKAKMNGSSPKSSESQNSSNGSQAGGDRRRASSDMDMFRNMARDIKKR